MDAKEYRQNCTQKAIEENMLFGWMDDLRGAGELGIVDTTGTPPTRETYFCRSPKSGNTYRLDWKGREGWTCECESCRYRGYCKHVAGLFLWAQRRGVTLPKAPPQVFTVGGKPLR